MPMPEEKGGGGGTNSALAPDPTLVRFRKARKAWDEARETGAVPPVVGTTTAPGRAVIPPGAEETSSIRARFALRVPEPPRAKRSLFRRLVILNLAVIATYGALSQLLAYRLGANVLSDAFQRQLVSPAMAALEDSMGSLLAAQADAAAVQSFLDRRYGSFPLMSVAVYGADGGRVGEHVGAPGPAPDPLPADARTAVDAGRAWRQPVDLGFVAVGAIRGGGPPDSGSGPVLGYIRVSARPSTTQTRNLIVEASWRWAFPVFLLALLTAYLGTRSITGRLREAEASVRRMAGGDMSARIPVGAMDEIGRVALTFNRTADLLQRTVKELEHTDETRRRMVADFAHELNTPLTNVLAYLETLQMGEEDGGMDATARRGFLQVAHDEAQRLAHLARDLETVTKLEAGRLVMERELVDVSRIAVELARRVMPRAEQQGLEVKTDIEPGGEIVGDRMRIEQVGMNLLENALRYTQAGSITIGVRAADDAVTLSIADTGVGISKEHVARVMDRFYRVDPSRTRGTGGSGLGLAIVSGIVDRHGGKVRIDSEAGRGTTVSIWLPREGSVRE
jgi:signal transduction histidine kinase